MNEGDWARFMSKLQESPDGCLLWTGTVTSMASGRYPTFCTGGRKLSARMLYFERTNGFRPPGVRSKCGSISCFRHLMPLQAQDAHRRRRQKEAMRDRMTGHPHKAPSARAADRVDELMAEGMSMARIAEKAGLSPSSVGRLMRRESETAYAFVTEAVLGVEPDGCGNIAGWGPRLPSPASGRMLMAMIADGFPQAAFLAKRLGVSDDFVKRAIACPSHRLFAKNIHAIRSLYRELDGVEPLTLGVTPFAKSRALSQARKGNYAPRHCWDDDTLDDPEAIPEWTGRCGTVEGYDIHLREGHTFYVPRKPTPGYESVAPGLITSRACQPCLDARAKARREYDGGANRIKVAALDAGGHSLRAIAAETGIPLSTVRYHMKKIRETKEDPS